MKILCVGDLHGRHELATLAFDTFLKGEYDKIIFHGDYADSYDRPDQDIIRTFHLVLGMKQAYPDKVYLLMGNHDEPYFHHDSRGYMCQGFRPSIHRALSHILIPRREEFSYAYGYSNFLFTHAGVNTRWFLKHFNRLEMWSDRMDIDIMDPTQLWMLIDNMGLTCDKNILFEIGPERKGYASDHGGPLWCDKDELINKGPITGLNQVVGHTSQQFISRLHTFEDNKKYKNTSVTFIDVLDNRHQFLTLEI